MDAETQQVIDEQVEEYKRKLTSELTSRKRILRFDSINLCSAANINVQVYEDYLECLDKLDKGYTFKHYFVPIVVLTWYGEFIDKLATTGQIYYSNCTAKCDSNVSFGGKKHAHIIVGLPENLSSTAFHRRWIRFAAKNRFEDLRQPGSKWWHMAPIKSKAHLLFTNIYIQTLQTVGYRNISGKYGIARETQGSTSWVTKLCCKYHTEHKLPTFEDKEAGRTFRRAVFEQYPDIEKQARDEWEALVLRRIAAKTKKRDYWKRKAAHEAVESGAVQQACSSSTGDQPGSPTT